LDAKNFDLHIFYTNCTVDQETNKVRQRAKSFLMGPKSIQQWVDEINNANINFLFYPEIGMDPMTLKLASMRLCPVQACSWGHPETSGLPTMDYYISSEKLDEDNANIYYSEKLVRLKGIGFYYDPPTLESNIEDLGDIQLTTGVPILLCLGAPNKFAPTADWIFFEIINRLKYCQLIFVEDENGAYKVLKTRLEKMFKDSDLEFTKFIKFIGPLNRRGYSELMKRSNLLLDTIGFSGFNTAMQAIGCNLPVITREGRYMRTKSASALLRTIGAPELIAESEHQYIDIIEKYIFNSDFSNNIKEKIRLNQDRLYKNIESIIQFESFIKSVVLPS